jgi:NADH dehydrogenase
MTGVSSSASPSPSARPRVVIIGAGFGGLWTAKNLANAAVEIVIIDRENYHLFQPLLYQVATAGLSPADIAAPIRGIVGAYRNVTVMLGEIVGVDVAAHTVSIMDGRHVPYDYLVIATGAHHAYFGHDEWKLLAPGLKRIEDATEIRRRILLAFERAENEADADERRRLMNLVIVGGGPTGVELAGAIAELARRWRRIFATSIQGSRASSWSRLGRTCCRAFRRTFPMMPSGVWSTLESKSVLARR